MAEITDSQIDQFLDTIEGWEDDQEWDNAIDRMGEAQPVLFTFLMTIGEDDFNEQEQELFIWLGWTLWEIMLLGNPEISLVDETRLNSIEHENLPLLEAMTEASLSEFLQELKTLTQEYPQPFLLDWIVTVVTEEESDELRPVIQPPMIVFLKIIVDCLNP